MTEAVRRSRRATARSVNPFLTSPGPAGGGSCSIEAANGEGARGPLFGSPRTIASSRPSPSRPQGVAAVRPRVDGPSADRRFTVLALLLAVVLGLNFPGFRIAVVAVPPAWLSFLRLVGGLGMLAPVLLYARLTQGPATTPSSRVGLLRGFLFGAGTIAVPTVLTMVAIVRVSAGEASVLSNTVPLWILLLAAAGLGSARPGRHEAATGTLGFLGVCLIVLPVGVGGSPGADLLLLVEAALTGVNGVLLKAWFPNVPAERVLLVSFLWSTLVLGAFALATEPVPSSLLRPDVLLIAVVGLGIVGTGIVWWLWYLLLERRRADRAAVYLYLGPVLSLALSVGFLGETLSGLEVLGIVLVLAAAFVLDARSALRRALLRTEGS